MNLSYATFVRLPDSDGDQRTVGYEVDAVDGEEVTLRKVGWSSSAPFFLSTTVAAIEALVAEGRAEVQQRSDGYHSSFAPPGECSYCDREREAESTFFPRHTASARCRSGHRDHCTCGTCW